LTYPPHLIIPDIVWFRAQSSDEISYAQGAIDEFSDAKKLPQIAISVDMLDTGIDVPEFDLSSPSNNPGHSLVPRPII